MIVGPYELESANARTTELDGELQVDVRVFDLDHLKKEFALVVDMHSRLQKHAVVDNLMCGRIQQASRCPRLHPSHQQLRQADLVQADRVSERSSIALDKLNCPPVVLDRVPQNVQVLINGAVGIVALPARGRTFL